MKLDHLVPRLLRERLARDPISIAAPRFDTIPSALLMADVLGFTSLAERLAAVGPHGAEELTRLLDRCFGELVALVTDHGGDVLEFVGDAILVHWEAEGEETLTTATLRATHCALAIQRAFDPRVIGDGARLSLRVTVAVGALNVSTVGEPERCRELLLWGAPLVQLADARSVAGAGEVGASLPVWTLIADRASGVPSGSAGVRVTALRDPSAPRPRPDRDVESDEALLQAHVPAAVALRLSEAGDRWIGELRRVTVLFVKLPTPDIHRGEAGVVTDAQAMMTSLLRGADHYEGTVNKVAVDEKGIMFLAAWGLPPLAHEDDAIRAVRAALALQTDLTARGASCAIGIASGQVYCGLVGSASRAEYTVIGDSVNLAARLMDAATASIWCDAATWRAARETLEFEALPPVAAKGKAEPVPVFSPTGRELVRVTRDVTVVGRERERDALASLIVSSQNRQGGALVFEGEAGVGKSTLVCHGRASAAEAGVTVLYGTGDAIERSTPYFAWRSVFRQLLGLAGSESLDVVGARAALHLGDAPELVGRSALLNVVLPVELPESPLTAQMAGEMRQDNTHALLVALLKRAVLARPTLLVLEDAHWMDAASWTLLGQVLAGVGELPLLLATRPLEASRSPAHGDGARSRTFSQGQGAVAPMEFALVTGSPGARFFRLDAMTREESTALICRRLGVPSVPPEVAALVFAKAEGNPFFSEEIAFALRDAALITVVDGRCQLASHAGDLRDVRLPDTVQGIVTSRVDRLAAPQRLTLKVASVLGHSFAVGILHGIHPADEHRQRLVELLDPMVDLELLRSLCLQPEREYSFKHNITEETVYNTMLFAQRRELHGKAAEWLEARHAADLSPYLPLLAHHWSRAEHWSRAIDYLEQAGRQALDRFANSAAIAFFAEAESIDLEHELGASRERRAYWQRSLSHANYGAGQHEQCAVRARQALSLLGWQVPTSKFGKGLGLLGQLALRGLQTLTPSLFRARSPEQRDRRLWAVRLQTRLSEIYLFTQDVGGMLYSVVRELNLAEPAGPSAELGRAFGTMAAIIGTVPLTSLSEACVRRAEENAAAAEPLDRAFMYVRCAVFGVYGAQWDRCERWLNEAEATGRHLGDGKIWQDATTILAIIAFFRGQFARSASLFNALRTVGVQRGLEQGQSWGRLGEGMALVRMGQSDAALPLFEAAMPWTMTKAAATEQAWAYGMSALAHLRSGHLAEARALADRTLAIVEAARPTAYWTQQSTAAICEIYWTLLRRAEPEAEKAALRRHLHRAVGAMQRFARVFPFGEGQRWLWTGLWLQASGNTGGAVAAFRRTVEVAERLGLQYEAGLGHRALGQVLTGAERENHLACAQNILGAIGAAEAAPEGQ